MLTDFHGLYTERSVGNRTVVGSGGADCLGIGTARGGFYGVDSMKTSSVEGKVRCDPTCLRLAESLL